MRNSSIQTWRNFTANIIQERDPHKIADLVAQLDRDLAEIKQPQTAVIDRNSSTA